MASDPRTRLPREDVRPVVAKTGGGASTALIATGVGIAALTLFLVLNGHRTANEAPAVRASAADRAAAVGQPAPPPLYVPPAPVVLPPEPVVIASAPVAQPAPPPRIVYVPQPTAPAPYVPPPQPVFVPQPPRDTGRSSLVIDTTSGDGVPGLGGDGPPSPNANVNNANAGFNNANTAAPGTRARATMLPARGTSVLQGSLIPAVLETALDSTRPGLARALVTRDVRGFDGSRVLIPRGSRLTGEYRADTQPGQNRALIVWTRLVRPDGAAIALASPVADTLGRAGVKASVNSHFLARFSAAILQSVLQVGVNLASRSNSDTYVLGIGGGAGVVGGQAFNQNQNIPPTLKVRPGASISVFVARDLDFTAVEGRR